MGGLGAGTQLLWDGGVEKAQPRVSSPAGSSPFQPSVIWGEVDSYFS